MTTSTGAPASGTGVAKRRNAKAAAASPTATEPLSLPQIRAAIPKECFVKSPAMSLYYMVRDLGMFSALLGAVVWAMQTPQWAAAPAAAQYAILLAYWMANGLVMWTCFVVGHDCGHGSFSDSWWLNAVCGHALHAPLLVPFFNWAESHRRHHQYHNHYERDYSFPWFTPDDLKAANRSVSHGIRVTFPFTGFAMYLAGLPDGGHWLPFGGRLWQSASVRRYTRGTISALSVAAWVWFVLALSGWDAATAFKLYGGCWLFFSYWLVTVTYLQHHDEDTIVYDTDWTFLRGAFQTIDREYGHGIDEFHHHISDCHLVHHLFFTAIPHYNLPKATQALRDFLAQRGLLKLHRRKKQHDFFLEVFRALYKFSFHAHWPSKEEVEELETLMPAKKAK